MSRKSCNHCVQIDSSPWQDLSKILSFTTTSLPIMLLNWSHEVDVFIVFLFVLGWKTSDTNGKTVVAETRLILNPVHSWMSCYNVQFAVIILAF